MPERLNEEIRRRTRAATPFPNEASLLQLVGAVPAEIPEEWGTRKVYLNAETKQPPQQTPFTEKHLLNQHKRLHQQIQRNKALADKRK